MNFLKWLYKFGKSFLWFGIILIGFTFLVTFLHYFNLISRNVVVIGKLITPILAFFFGGFILSKNSLEKGWLEGLKCGILFLLCMIFIRLFLHSSFSLQHLLYYFILIFGSVFGGMLGINFTTKEK